MKKADFLVNESISRIKYNSETEDFLYTGFLELDRLIGGLQQSELIVFASRPSMGKTSFGISIINHLAINLNKKIGIFSLEMPAFKFTNRMISQVTDLTYSKLSTGNLKDYEWKSLYVKAQGLENSQFSINDNPHLTIEELMLKCEEMVEGGIDCIFIDYLQLIEPMPSKHNFGNREQEISYIIRMLKHTAGKLNIPIVVMSQLSRAVETRGASRRPFLSDLRDSGAIEDHADLVGFIYRPDYYKLEVWDDENATPCLGQAEIIIAKHRNGETGNIRLGFDLNTGKFEDIENDFVHNHKESFANSINLPEFNPADSFGNLEDFDDSEDDGLDF